MSLLSDRIALVTGANGALGSVVTSALADAGATVIGTYRSEWPEQDRQHIDLAIQCDVTKESEVERCFSDTEDAHGSPDIIVHTVGGFASDGSLEDTSLETWNRMLHMNLTSSFLVTRQALRSMEKGGRKQGRIILVSSASAFADEGGAVAYRTAKAAIRSLIRIVQAEQKGGGPSINAVAPGIIDTPQNRADMPGADTSSWISPEDIAATILHLCSPAGGPISGAVIPLP